MKRCNCGIPDFGCVHQLHKDGETFRSDDCPLEWKNTEIRELKEALTKAGSANYWELKKKYSRLDNEAAGLRSDNHRYIKELTDMKVELAEVQESLMKYQCEFCFENLSVPGSVICQECIDRWRDQRHAQGHPVVESEDPDMDVNKYQKECTNFALGMADKPWYCALGLNGEAGEVAEKIKKLYRDDGFRGVDISPERTGAIVKEMGDVAWYLAALATSIGVPLSRVLQANLDKLDKRLRENKLGGDGDDR